MKNIFFDLYGTLIDIHTDEENTSFWIKLAKKTKKYSKYHYLDLKNSYLKLVRKLEEKKEEIEILEVFKRLYNVDEEKAFDIAQIFRKLSTKYEKCYKGVKKLLNELTDKGYNIYLLSNAQASFTVKELEKLGLINYFKDIYISSDYGVKKPNVEFFKIALKKNNLKPEEVIMIGNDYSCDIKPAISLGLKTIYINSNLTFSDQEKADLNGFDKEKIINLINSFKL